MQLRIASGNCSHGGGRCRSQTEDLNEEKLSGKSALPKDTRQHRKMSQKLASEMMNNDKNSVACGSANGDSRYRPIVGCEVVMVIGWPGSSWRLAKVVVVFK